MLQVSQAFALGMRYIQKAVKYRKKDEAKAQSNIRKFFELCDAAEASMAIAAVKPKHRGLCILKTINDERNQILVALNSCQKSQSAKPQEVAALMRVKDMLTVTYGQAIKAVREDTPLPTLIAKTVQVTKVVRHDEVPAEALLLSISQFIGSMHGVVSYRIKVKRGDKEEAVFDGIIPGNVSLSATINGVRPADESRRARIRRSELVFEIYAMKKRAFGGVRESLRGQFSVKMESWAKECVFEKTAVVKGEKKDQYTVALKGVMREPLERECVTRESIVVHVSDSAEQVVQEQAPQAKAQTHAGSVPKPAPTKAAQQARATAGAKPGPAPAKAPAKQPPPLYLLKDWEWERFLAANVLQFLKERIEYAIYLCKERKIEVPKVFNEELARVDARLEAIVKKFTPGTEEMYMNMVTKQIEEDKKKLAEISDATCKQNFAERLKLMEDWLKEATEDE